MMNNKISWFVVISTVTLLSGCLTKNVVQNVLTNSVLPYGVGAGMSPQRDYSSATPQRSYSSAATSSDNGTPPARAFSSKTIAPNMGCLANINTEEMEKRARQAQIFSEEMKALCQAGKRAQATKRAMQFGKEMATNSVFTKEMQECLEKQTMMPYKPTTEPIDHKKHHVCDSFQD